MLCQTSFRDPDLGLSPVPARRSDQGQGFRGHRDRDRPALHHAPGRGKAFPDSKFHALCRAGHTPRVEASTMSAVSLRIPVPPEDKFFLMFEGLGAPVTGLWGLVFEGVDIDRERLLSAVGKTLVRHPKAAARL